MKGKKMKQIESVRVLTVGTTAQSAHVQGLAFLVENNSESATVYFKEKADDGVAASADNGFVLGPGALLNTALTATELSLVASAADTDVRLLILNEM